MTQPHPYTIRTFSPVDTQAVGTLLGQCLHPGQVLALSGDLGAGKTTFTQGIGRGLGVAARITSPTFTLVNEYMGQNSTGQNSTGQNSTGQNSAGQNSAGQNNVRLIHTDSYRLGDPDGADMQDALMEAATFGMAEILDDPGAVIVIEWAERIAALLPDDHLAVTLSHLDASGASPGNDPQNDPGDDPEQARTLAFFPRGPVAVDTVQRLVALVAEYAQFQYPVSFLASSDSAKKD